jgi:hypothetical protein
MASCGISASLVLAVFLAGSGAASDTEMDRATLRGIKAVKVIVDPTPPEIEREGLDRDHLRSRIEQKLRDAGITLDGDAAEFVGLNITSVRGVKTTVFSLKGGPLSLMIGLGVYQVVTLNRDKTAKTVAETWSQQRVMSAAPKAVAEAVSSAVDELADDFVKAYRSVNHQ